MNARTLVCLLLAGLALPVPAAEPVSLLPPPQPSSSTLATNAAPGGVLPVDTAFAMNAFVAADGNLVILWELPEGYYLYRKSLTIESGGVDLLPALELPEAETLTDEFFGEVAVYRQRLLARIPPEALAARPGTTLELLLGYQGCAENLYCYPSVQKSLSVQFPD